MKIVLLIAITLSMVGCSSCSSKKQGTKIVDTIELQPHDKSSYRDLKDFKNDSVDYLKENFIVHKDFYKNKKLEVLLNSLELPIEKYLVSTSPSFQKSTGILLIFNDDVDMWRNKQKGKYILLNISWQNPIEEKVDFNLLNRSKTKWNDEVNDFYKKRIIKDINMISTSK